MLLGEFLFRGLLWAKRVMSPHFLWSFVQRLLVFSVRRQLFLKAELKLGHDAGSTGIKVEASLWLISSELADYLNQFNFVPLFLLYELKCFW